MIDGEEGATVVSPSRPPVTAMSDDDVIGIGPAGNYGIAAHREAIGFISRPLATPPVAGVTSFVADYNGLGLRVTMSYEGRAQNVLVTVDLLCGTTVFYPERGTVLLG